MGLDAEKAFEARDYLRDKGIYATFPPEIKPQQGDVVDIPAEFQDSWHTQTQSGKEIWILEIKEEEVVKAGFNFTETVKEMKEWVQENL